MENVMNTSMIKKPKYLYLTNESVNKMYGIIVNAIDDYAYGENKEELILKCNSVYHSIHNVYAQFNENHFNKNIKLLPHAQVLQINQFSTYVNYIRDKSIEYTKDRYSYSLNDDQYNFITSTLWSYLSFKLRIMTESAYLCDEIIKFEN